MEDDLGWQQTPLMRKFHYFVHTTDRSIEQMSLCGGWGLGPGGREPDLDPPNDESCKGCARKYEKAYGKKET